MSRPIAYLVLTMKDGEAYVVAMCANEATAELAQESSLELWPDYSTLTVSVQDLIARDRVGVEELDSLYKL